MIDVRLCAAPLDLAAALAALEAGGGGGIATFTGLVRGEGGIVELLLEHHPRLTLPALEAIARAAAERWSLAALTVHHRYGAMAPGERIVFVGAAARHRGAALDACAFVIDRLKTEAPFWKRERFADGTTRWVEERAADHDAAARWATAPPR